MKRYTFRGWGRALLRAFGPPYDREGEAEEGKVPFVHPTENPFVAAGALRQSARHLKTIAVELVPAVTAPGEECPDNLESAMRKLAEKLGGH